MAFKLENIPNAQHGTDRASDLERLLKKEIVLFGSGFSNKKKHAFYHELGVLLNAGITIKEALNLIIESFKKQADKQVFEDILQQVINGKPFSQALHSHKYFSEYEYYSLKIGEETGTTARVCWELGIFYERKNEQRRIVGAALTYPAIVISTALIVVVFMLTFVVPMFEGIFRQNNTELPFLTRVIVKMSSLTQQYGFIFIILIIGLVIAARMFKDNHAYRSLLHGFILKIPVLGPFTTKVYLAQFTQAVSLLTAAKVPMLNSIQMVAKMIRFVPLQNALQDVEQNILKGRSLSESLKGNSLFDSRIISLVKVAEETNQTEYVFTQLNEQYSQEVVQQSKVMSTVLEPLIIVFVGVIVAVLLIAMYLPMFQLSSAIG